MSVVADIGDDRNPLRFLYWYEFAAFTVVISMGFILLIALFHYFG